jgi:DNA-binding HxlR family transcriptional regulator
MWALGATPQRFGEIRRLLTGVSEKVLAENLRQLEASGVVHREVYPEVPPRVEYSLTSLGRELAVALRPLEEWGERHRDDKIYDCGFYDAQAHVTVSGISGTPSSGVQMVNCGVSGTIALDWVNDFSFLGGVVTTITNTANVGGNCIVIPAVLVNPFTRANNNAGRFFGLMRHSTQNHATAPGSFRFTHNIVLENAQDLAGENAAGSTALRMIGMNAADRVLLARDGSDIQIGRALIALGGGAAPTLGTIGGSGPATAGQNTWLKLFDSAGNAFYVPVWK